MSDVQSAYHQTREQIDRESELIRAAKNDPARFDVLYKKYFEQIFYFVLKRVETEDIADDITSQVFLKALTKLSAYRDMGLPFSSWLFRIARNEVYDFCAKNKIGMVVSVESSGVSKMIAEMGEAGKEDFSHLYHALGTLSDDDMELIELRFFEKRYFKEIGEILDITENNAKVKTYRILEKLKKALNNEK